MSPALRILSPGLLTTVQDLGRPGYQSLGIPVGGALDPAALRAANVLVGNATDSGALEIAYIGPTLQVEADDVRLACVGADAPIEVFANAEARGSRRLRTMRTARLRRGEVIRVGSLARGAVLYLAVEGGFEIEPVLGSVSTYLRGRFGGWEGRALVSGDRLPLRRTKASERVECELQGVDFTAPATVRATLGPQADRFSEREIAALFAGEFTVATGSDRMGLRLSGPLLRQGQRCEMVSEAVAPGSIQVTGGGEPIVLLADRQTTGGYPKIATVISADLAAVGRLPIGAKIKFAPVSIDLALALRRQHVAELDDLHSHVVGIRLEQADLRPGLYQNLISGVVDARA